MEDPRLKNGFQRRTGEAVSLLDHDDIASSLGNLGTVVYKGARCSRIECVIITTTLTINCITFHPNNNKTTSYISPKTTTSIMFSKNLSPVLLLSLLSSISANPIPDLPGNDCAHWQDSYSITSQTKYVAWPRLVTGVTVVGCNGA